ncbi:EamA family transporter [Fusibacter sp. 3D3]|uniref:EamA family transporter n=1 Tax=Fusibacter sp. 3D3 TaxID=1048380 RepID=UPI000856B40C|nr:EamA family transporter [Fusibacter sp. 3D3]GAU78517.1 permease of the drug/metabolite transporter DMT superfamily [Fusibacter sp. 3D3]
MKNKVFMAYLAVCFFWGSTYLAIKIGVTDMPPMFFAGSRFLIAGSIMLTYAKLKGLPFPKGFKSIKGLSIVGILMLLGGNGLIVYAEQWVDSGVASMMVATMPLFIALLERLLIRSVKLSKLGYFGLLIGFYGVYRLITPSGLHQGMNPTYVGIILLATFLWSLGSVYSKMVVSEGSIVNNIGIQMLSGGIGLMIISVLAGELSRLTLSRSSLMALAYLIVFGSIVGYSSYIYVLAHWPATKAGTYAYINPMVAMILGFFILNEPVTIQMVSSMIIILLGVFAVQRSKIQV